MRTRIGLDRQKDVARELDSDVAGLDPDEAARRLVAFGPNALAPERTLSSLRLIYEQVKSPLILILAFAAVVSVVVANTRTAPSCSPSW